jgi:hypothetical protein
VSPAKYRRGSGKKPKKPGRKKPKKPTQVSPSEKPMLIRRGADKREKNNEKGGKKEGRWVGLA